MSDVLPALRDRIQATTFVDTHEHLIEEASRLAEAGSPRLRTNDDFASLFHNYARDDLVSAGMPASDLFSFLSPTVEPAEKWRLVEPYWRHCRHTGYIQAVAYTAERLFDHREWSAASVERLSDARLPPRAPAPRPRRLRPTRRRMAASSAGR